MSSERECGEVTELLRSVRAGNPESEARLIDLIYGELRELASIQMRGENPSHTLTPTALVNEAYLRLAGALHHSFQDRTHFLAVAANAMRRILVDHARARLTAKRGGAVVPISLEEASVPDREHDDARIIAVNDALERLSRVSVRQGRVVELRYFAGLTEEEIASVLGVTRRTVNRDWQMARAWLFGQLRS